MKPLPTFTSNNLAVQLSSSNQNHSLLQYSFYHRIIWPIHLPLNQLQLYEGNPEWTQYSIFHTCGYYLHWTTLYLSHHFNHSAVTFGNIWKWNWVRWAIRSIWRFAVVLIAYKITTFCFFADNTKGRINKLCVFGFVSFSTFVTCAYKNLEINKLLTSCRIYLK